MRTPEQILTAIAEANSVTVDDILGRSRQRRIADARKMAMAALRVDTDMTLHQVGDYLGKDHATILHAERTHADLMLSDRHYAERYTMAMRPERTLPRQLYAGKIVLQPCRA